MAKITQVLDDLAANKPLTNATSYGAIFNDAVTFAEELFDANATNADKVEALLTLANSILAKASEGGLLGNRE